MNITKTVFDSAKFIKQNPVVIIPGMIAALIHSLVMIFTKPAIGRLYSLMAAHPKNFMPMMDFGSVAFVEAGFFLSVIATFYAAIWIVSITKNKKSLSYTASVSIKKFPVVLVSTIIFFFVLMGGFMILIIPGIYLLVRLIFFPQAIILENKDVFSSLSRSWNLTKNKTLDVFVFLVAMGAIISILSVPNLIIDNIFFNSLYSFILMSVFTPFFYISLTLYYNKLKKWW